MKRMARRVVVLLSAALLGAGTVQAQTIAGIVRDSSGAVLPGATVEVASPALIEKVRSATTDGAGQYRIVSLSPGLYSVTVSMPGFNTHKREGIELTTDFTATVTLTSASAPSKRRSPYRALLRPSMSRPLHVRRC